MLFKQLVTKILLSKSEDCKIFHAEEASYCTNRIFCINKNDSLVTKIPFLNLKMADIYFLFKYLIRQLKVVLNIIYVLEQVFNRPYSIKLLISACGSGKFFTVNTVCRAGKPAVVLFPNMFYNIFFSYTGMVTAVPGKM